MRIYRVECLFLNTVDTVLKVVVTDYPDESLVENMRFNISENIEKEDIVRVDVQACNRNIWLKTWANQNSQGYIWGHSPEPLLKALPPSSPKFDLIILSDLIFNHSQVCHLPSENTRAHALPPSTKPSLRPVNSRSRKTHQHLYWCSILTTGHILPTVIWNFLPRRRREDGCVTKS